MLQAWLMSISWLPMFAVLFLGISTFAEFLCVLLYAYLFPKLPIVKYYRSKAASEGSKTVSADLAAAGIQTPADHQVFPPFFLIFLWCSFSWKDDHYFSYCMLLKDKFHALVYNLFSSVLAGFWCCQISGAIKQQTTIVPEYRLCTWPIFDIRADIVDFPGILVWKYWWTPVGNMVSSHLSSKIHCHWGLVNL